LAYRSAKKRKLEEVESTLFRKILETVAIFAIPAVVVFQNDLKTAIVADPVSNLIIPFWALAAYLLMTLKTKN
jgi:hypothetical protein